MADWFSNLANQAMKIADDFTESLVSQATEAQEQLQSEQRKMNQEESQRQQQLSTSTQLPWETQDESLQILSDELMNKILTLSLNDGNFTDESANAGDIDFVFSDFVATVLQLLKLDANLARVHAKISPKMDEETFWRNYYCRVVYLRAVSGIDGPLASKDAARWADADIVLQPSATSRPLAAAGVSGDRDQASSGGADSRTSSSGAKAAAGSAKGGMSAGEAKVGAGDDDEEDDDVDLGDMDLDLDLDLDDLDEDELDLDDLDDLDLLGGLGDADDRDGDGDDDSPVSPGTRDRVGTDADTESFEEVTRSDCNSNNSNAELEAQIAAELASDELDDL
ncbi:hypothetical protein B484DRAFT_396418 [Ochromonadaceae sp. CCMP2298]|nr:hypothetical protein B484DRAFT_396418 [Ochromonadaceae sp. CCMP2298]|mmetsp:Transcript_15244/g.33646  ORF Transcript_15244/g.33646 Transcript_15244/m.33646 type:complete len:338 (-) Transcript_15244:1604-2617(-)